MRVLNSTYDTRHMAEEDIWFSDPVPPLDQIYRRITVGVIKMAAKLKEKDRQNSKGGELTAGTTQASRKTAT
jgi:hypothetical protein